jgi:capsular exopolysaccharide synthesis family protein
MPSHNLLDINWIIAVLRRWLWLIIGLTVLTAVVAYVAFSMMPAEYSATVTMLVDSPKNNASSQYNDLVAAERIAYTDSQMLKDRAVMEAAVSKLGINMTPQSLAGKITISSIPQTQLLQLSATSDKPEEASLFANTVAETFADHVQVLSKQRYEGELKSAQSKVADLQKEVDNTQLEINSIQAKKIDNDVKLSQLKSNLDRYQSDYRLLQQNYQDLQMTVAQATGEVHLVEPVQILQTTTALKSATIIMSIGERLSMGQNNVSSDRVALSYGQLLFSTPLIQGVIKDFGLTETPTLFARRVHVDLVPGTQLLRLRVDGDNEEKAKAWCVALSNAFMEKVKALVAEPYSSRLVILKDQLDTISGSITKTQDEMNTLSSENMYADSNLQSLTAALANSRTNFQNSQRDLEQLNLTIAQTADAVTITEPAHTPKRSNNNRNLYATLAALVGLVLGAALSIFLGYMDGRMRTRQDVTEALKFPLLGSIGKFGANELVINAEPNSHVAENFRALSTKIRLLCTENSLHTLLVTSPAPAEGKSVVAANLSVALARMGLRVVAVDADLWRPRLHTLFGMSQGSGLTSFLSGGTWTDKLMKPAVNQLDILTSGDVTLNPSEHLSSPYLGKLFDELAQKADLVIIDCPPVLSAADASILASQVDGILLVVRAGKTDAQAAREAVSNLDQVKSKIIGVVLNAVQDRNENYHRYYYGKVKVAATKDAPISAKQP